MNLHGLFDFRKNETKKIEKYNDEESKIKTNVINVGQGGPINTADILEQLRKMKEDLEKQTGESKGIEGKQDKESNAPNNEKNIEEANENKEESIKVNETENETQEENELQQKEPNAINQEENTEKEQNVENDSKNEEKTEENPQAKLEEINKQIEELKSIQYEEKTELNFSEMYEKLFGKKPSTDPENIEETSNATVIDLKKDNISVFEDVEEYQKPMYKFIGIVFNTYIIIEIDKEMYILDQHAAHERIMYEKVKKNYYSEQSKDSQLLLLPDIITLSHKEMEIAKDNFEMFEKAGFTLEEFGENTIKLTGVPTICIDIDNKELFLETLDEIDTVSRTAKQEKEEKFIATVACKAAVKANMVLTKEEVESLMDKLLELPNPFTCPHGRPTAIKMTKYDIERKFARK